jgi:toxin ParE1/3/4
MAARKRPVIWSPEAETDLTDIWNYYRDVAGQQMAGSRVRAISEACLLLEEHPLIGRARDEVRPGLRSVLVSPHVVFYRISNETAQIVRILDGRRDIEDTFGES